MSIDTLTVDGAPVTLAPGVDTAGHPFSFMGYAAVPGSDKIVALTASQVTGASPGGPGSTPSDWEIAATGYSLTGAQTFQTPVVNFNGLVFAPATSPAITLLANGAVAIAFLSHDPFSNAGNANNDVAVVSPSGAIVANHLLNYDGGSFEFDGQTYGYIHNIMNPPVAFYATATGFGLEWNEESFQSLPSLRNAYVVDPFTLTGQEGQRAITLEDYPTQITPTAHGFGGTVSSSVQLADNTLQYWDGATLHDPVTIPGEPVRAITDETAALLTGGQFAVAWVDSGTDYVSLFNPTTESFGMRIGLDWGGVSDIHVVGLPDGGFAVSWTNGGAFKGEVFDVAGNGGGIIPLAGDVAGITSHGDLYTVALDSSGQYDVQTYAINGSGGGGGGTTGQTFNSDNNGDVWVGTAGNDTFNLGRGGDWVTGNGGNDTYKFAGIPWAGGGVTDFNAGDVLDLTGLMSTTSDTGTDGFADGYLKITDDGSGNAQVWADYHITGNDGWWLVTTLDGVAPSSLTHTGDVITVGSPSGGGGGGGGTTGPTSVSTSDPTYTAPSSVNSITLTGSQQTVTANNAQDTTIWSNNTGNVLNGGTGDDTIHIGRGGDYVTGGAGKDVFVFGDIPWASATIADLMPGEGDSIDVSGILAKAGYTGSDPIADGYLQIRNNTIYADYHLPGNDGWWQVATVYTPGFLQYAGNGVIDDVGEHVGGTVTTSGSGVSTAGYDTIVMTGSNGQIVANDGGDSLIDQGSNNRMFGGKGNDTLVLGTSTTEASDHWGGVNTWVLNPDSTVLTHSLEGLGAGDRLDVRALLSASHYTGADPVGDGYVFMANPPPPSFGEMGDFVRSQLMYDPDGTAGPQAARALFDTYYTTPNQFHYADGFFVVQ